jgi:hypothetical protein
MIVVPPCGWVAAIDRGTVSVGPKAAVAEFLLSRPVAAVRARHRDRPLIGAFVFDVGTVQWFPKNGKEHPLKAIGYVAALAVILGAVAGRAVFGA